MAGALPDWTVPAPLAEGRAFPAFERPDVAVALPLGLAVADEPGGDPAFRLTAVRPARPDPGDPDRALLELRLRLVYPDAPGAEQAAPVRGELALLPSDSVTDARLTPPPPESLDWLGLGLARLSVPLDPAAASLIEAALADGPLPFTARADIEIDGVSPRAPARVVVAGKRLAAALAAHAPDGFLARDGLLALLRGDLASLGLTVTAAGPEPAPGALAEALADRIRVRFGRFAAPSGLGAPGFALAVAERDAPDEIAWNLAETLVAPRSFSLGLDPFAEARELARRVGRDALVRRVVTPELSLGFRRLLVEAALLQRPAGVALAAVNIVLPPHPPGRPQEIRKSVDLTHAEVTPVDVRLAPDEELAWTAACVMMLETPAGMRRLDGPPRSGAGWRVSIRPADLPARFVRVEASPALTALADLDVACEAGGAPVAKPVRLDASRPSASLTLPRDLADARLVATAVSPRDGARLALAPRDAQPCRFDVTDLPGYGPRAASLAARLDGAPLLALEVRPESAGDEAVEPVLLTADRDTRLVTWFAADPFRPGLMWRPRQPDGAPPLPWRGPIQDGEALSVPAGAPEGATP
ncbi:hypothetical protein NK718_20015 [Alsobacter sp. SYSU M60028]|uniref:Uncharacterized protein n=1 Tax=Alsobacter ponti TaxID=2962936 RepID=A0ABT1LKP5_9HYPH|nr:hypothetical protein [Alsobacter ponti]MCP8940818.1 hypothetical protein [Alsobacter ponti]